jgi:hypothetical protein
MPAWPYGIALPHVMAGLVSATQGADGAGLSAAMLWLALERRCFWVPGTSPGMTEVGVGYPARAMGSDSSSVTTWKPARVAGPKLVMIATSMASRP